jgi:hypothetical protein
MLNFFDQRRAWNDLIFVFLKCGCSGAGLTISAAMAITVVAWRVLRKNPVEKSRDQLSTVSTTTKDPHLAAIQRDPPLRETHGSADCRSLGLA